MDGAEFFELLFSSFADVVCCCLVALDVDRSHVMEVIGRYSEFVFHGVDFYERSLDFFIFIGFLLSTVKYFLFKIDLAFDSLGDHINSLNKRMEQVFQLNRQPIPQRPQYNRCLNSSKQRMLHFLKLHLLINPIFHHFFFISFPDKVSRSILSLIKNSPSPLIKYLLHILPLLILVMIVEYDRLDVVLHGLVNVGSHQDGIVIEKVLEFPVIVF